MMLQGCNEKRSVTTRGVHVRRKKGIENGSVKIFNRGATIVNAAMAAIGVGSCACIMYIYTNTRIHESRPARAARISLAREPKRGEPIWYNGLTRSGDKSRPATFSKTRRRRRDSQFVLSTVWRRWHARIRQENAGMEFNMLHLVCAALQLRQYAIRISAMGTRQSSYQQLDWNLHFQISFFLFFLPGLGLVSHIPRFFFTQPRSVGLLNPPRPLLPYIYRLDLTRSAFLHFFSHQSYSSQLLPSEARLCGNAVLFILVSLMMFIQYPESATFFRLFKASFLLKKL